MDLLYEKAMAVAPWPKGGLSNRKDRVMEFYQGRREQFPAIRGWMLDDKNLFNLRQGQERFDFRVELFRKIVNFYFGCDISIREMRPRVKNLQKDPSKKSTP